MPNEASWPVSCAAYICMAAWPASGRYAELLQRRRHENLQYRALEHCAHTRCAHPIKIIPTRVSAPGPTASARKCCSYANKLLRRVVAPRRFWVPKKKNMFLMGSRSFRALFHKRIYKLSDAFLQAPKLRNTSRRCCVA